MKPPDVLMSPATVAALGLLIADIGEALQSCVEALEEADLYSRETTQRGRELLARLERLADDSSLWRK